MYPYRGWVCCARERVNFLAAVQFIETIVWNVPFGSMVTLYLCCFPFRVKGHCMRLPFPKGLHWGVRVWAISVHLLAWRGEKTKQQKKKTIPATLSLHISSLLSLSVSHIFLESLEESKFRDLSLSISLSLKCVLFSQVHTRTIWLFWHVRGNCHGLFSGGEICPEDLRCGESPLWVALRLMDHHKKHFNRSRSPWSVESAFLSMHNSMYIHTYTLTAMLTFVSPYLFLSLNSYLDIVLQSIIFLWLNTIYALVS